VAGGSACKWVTRKAIFLFICCWFGLISAMLSALAVSLASIASACIGSLHKPQRDMARSKAIIAAEKV